MEEYGEDWSEKPVSSIYTSATWAMPTNTHASQNDMLQWVMEEAASRDPSVKAIAERLLVVNFAAIHTSSNVR